MLQLGKGVLAQLEEGGPDIISGEKGEHGERQVKCSKP